MKIEIDGHMVNDLKDKLMVAFLKDDLNTVIEAQSCEAWMHEDDVKYNKKLIKAYKRILSYYGHDTE